ncbi:MAG: LecA/PA-IL family lectin [Acidobacteriota bacterium]
MKTGWRAGVGLGMTTMLVLVAAVSADTLYLRSGRRIEGELVSVRNGEVQFREQSGWSGRTLRFSVDEVDRIEFGRESWDDDRDSKRGMRPSGMREREVVVTAAERWNDTGVDVRAGQVVYFEARGQVRWGPNRRDGAAGENDSPHNPGRPIPARPAAALIGQIGDGDDAPFFIGDNTGPIRMRESGRLYLGINDDVLTDNSGNFRVVVYY